MFYVYVPHNARACAHGYNSKQIKRVSCNSRVGKLLCMYYLNNCIPSLLHARRAFLRPSTYATHTQCTHPRVRSVGVCAVSFSPRLM
jgi:hypothetical protein